MAESVEEGSSRGGDTLADRLERALRLNERQYQALEESQTQVKELKQELQELKQELQHAKNQDTDLEYGVGRDTTPTDPPAESAHSVPQSGNDTTHPGSLRVDPGVLSKLTDMAKRDDRETAVFNLSYVRTLSLETLTGPDSESHIRTFCRQVEWLLKQDGHRVEAALSRMENPVEQRVLQELDSKKMWDWNTLKQALTKFDTGQNTLSKAWENFMREEYHVEDEPGRCVERMKYKLAAIESKFEVIQGKDQLMKDVLYEGLPGQMQRELRRYHQLGIFLEPFLNELTKCREWYLRSQGRGQQHVRQTRQGPVPEAYRVQGDYRRNETDGRPDRNTRGRKITLKVGQEMNGADIVGRIPIVRIIAPPDPDQVHVTRA
ncbi:hypothetical protein Hamer_G028879 [Homarus americanus]|uniref:Uncharacterized protein n=1 Tax=Homarus americanus TaxID=6706 RepID=A0A8J5TUA4_HOMAM|nr:hypothetical protein Hamer_G028879 [Homarus americanus]